MMRMLRIKCGPQVYGTLAGRDALRFVHTKSAERSSRKLKERGKIPRSVDGINKPVLTNFSVALYENNSCLSAGDATRQSRIYSRMKDKFIGKMRHPDVSASLIQPEEVYVPERASDVRKLILLTRKLNQLGAEVYTEQFRCISDKTRPPLAHTVYVEASNGKSGFLHLKYWFTILLELDGVPLSLEGFITDGCSVGISAGHMMCTPTEEMIGHGCSYLGLPVDDFKHYAIYCRTAIRGPKARDFIIDDGNQVGYEVPMPIQYLIDPVHWYRLVRKNTDGLAYLVFFTEKLDDLEGSVVASFDHLRRLSQTRLVQGLPLKDICTINKYADFKDDAAKHLLSSRTITLLEAEAPEDKATILVLKACHHVAKVFAEDTTNALLAVEYMYRCSGVFELQERYVMKVLKIKRPSDCLPSYQFRDAVDIMADFTVTHFLAFHRHMLSKGKKWTESGLSQANADELEGTHGHGRGLLGNDVNFNFKRWLDILSTLFETASCQKTMEESGVIFGAPGHKQQRLQGRIDLGTLVENMAHDLSCQGYLPPDDYDAFVEDLIAARERGLAWARREYINAFGPLCFEQFDSADEWTERALVPADDKYLKKPVHATLSTGVEVTIEGLTSNTELNGSRAVCVKCVAIGAPERWAVSLASEGSESYSYCYRSIKSTNLRTKILSPGIVLGCRRLEPSSGPLVAVDLRKRDVMDLPDGITIASGNNVALTVVPASPINPDDLVVPKKVEKAIDKLEAQLKEHTQFLVENDGDVMGCFGIAEETGSTAGAEALMAEREQIIAEAKVFREGMHVVLEEHRAAQKEKAKLSSAKRKAKKKRHKTDKDANLLRTCKPVMQLTETGNIDLIAIAKADVVLEDDGTYVSTDRVTCLCQESDRVDRSRCRRFIVGRLNNFSRALRQGHDITLGSCMAIKWGSAKQFAVVRVMKMYGEDNVITYSQKLNRKSRKQQFRVELLVPYGGDALGAQRYRSSGWRLGPVAGTRVLCLVDMIAASRMPHASLDARRSDACLPIDKIMEYVDRGWEPMSVDCHGDISRYVKEVDQESEPIEGWSPLGVCYSCKCSWYDHTKGAIVPCVKCGRRYHQECTQPRIKNEQVHEWECLVCSGGDKDLCQGCNEPYSEQEVECPNSLENNELVQCQQCSCWWHQACHEPALYPLPVHFSCKQCPTLGASEPAAPTVHPSDRRAPRQQRPRQPRQPQQPAAPAPAPAERSRRSTASYTAHCQVATNDLQVGTVVMVYWEDDDRSYKGTVAAIDDDDGTYEIKYDDGTRDWEDLLNMDFTVVSQPSYRDTSRVNETRNDRLNWT